MRTRTVLNRNRSRYKEVSGIKLTGTYDGFTDVKRQCEWFANDRKIVSKRYQPKTEIKSDEYENQLA